MQQDTAASGSPDILAASPEKKEGGDAACTSPAPACTSSLAARVGRTLSLHIAPPDDGTGMPRRYSASGGDGSTTPAGLQLQLQSAAAKSTTATPLTHGSTATLAFSPIVDAIGAALEEGDEEATGALLDGLPPPFRRTSVHGESPLTTPGDWRSSLTTLRPSDVQRQVQLKNAGKEEEKEAAAEMSATTGGVPLVVPPPPLPSSHGSGSQRPMPSEAVAGGATWLTPPPPPPAAAGSCPRRATAFLLSLAYLKGKRRGSSTSTTSSTTSSRTTSRRRNSSSTSTSSSSSSSDSTASSASRALCPSLSSNDEWNLPRHRGRPARTPNTTPQTPTRRRRAGPGAGGGAEEEAVGMMMRQSAEPIQHPSPIPPATPPDLDDSGPMRRTSGAATTALATSPKATRNGAAAALRGLWAASTPQSPTSTSPQDEHTQSSSAAATPTKRGIASQSDNPLRQAPLPPYATKNHKDGGAGCGSGSSAMDHLRPTEGSGGALETTPTTSPPSAHAIIPSARQVNFLLSLGETVLRPRGKRSRSCSSRSSTTTTSSSSSSRTSSTNRSTSTTSSSTSTGAKTTHGSDTSSSSSSSSSSSNSRGSSRSLRSGEGRKRRRHRHHKRKNNRKHTNKSKRGGGKRGGGGHGRSRPAAEGGGRPHTLASPISTASSGGVADPTAANLGGGGAGGLGAGLFAAAAAQEGEREQQRTWPDGRRPTPSYQPVSGGGTGWPTCVEETAAATPLGQEIVARHHPAQRYAGSISPASSGSSPTSSRSNTTTTSTSTSSSSTTTSTSATSSGHHHRRGKGGRRRRGQRNNRRHPRHRAVGPSRPSPHQQQLLESAAAATASVAAAAAGGDLPSLLSLLDPTPQARSLGQDPLRCPPSDSQTPPDECGGSGAASRRRSPGSFMTISITPGGQTYRAGERGGGMAGSTGPVFPQPHQLGRGWGTPLMTYTEALDRHLSERGSSTVVQDSAGAAMRCLLTNIPGSPRGEGQRVRLRMVPALQGDLIRTIAAAHAQEMAELAARRHSKRPAASQQQQRRRKSDSIRAGGRRSSDQPSTRQSRDASPRRKGGTPCLSSAACTPTTSPSHREARSRPVTPPSILPEPYSAAASASLVVAASTALPLLFTPAFGDTLSRRGLLPLSPPSADGGLTPQDGLAKEKKKGVNPSVEGAAGAFGKFGNPALSSRADSAPPQLLLPPPALLLPPPALASTATTLGSSLAGGIEQVPTVARAASVLSSGEQSRAVSQLYPTAPWNPRPTPPPGEDLPKKTPPPQDRSSSSRSFCGNHLAETAVGHQVQVQQAQGERGCMDSHRGSRHQHDSSKVGTKLRGGRRDQRHHRHQQGQEHRGSDRGEDDHGSPPLDAAAVCRSSGDAGRFYGVFFLSAVAADPQQFQALVAVAAAAARHDGDDAAATAAGWRGGSGESTHSAEQLRQRFLLATPLTEEEAASVVGALPTPLALSDAGPLSGIPSSGGGDAVMRSLSGGEHRDRHGGPTAAAKSSAHRHRHRHHSFVHHRHHDRKGDRRHRKKNTLEVGEGVEGQEPHGQQQQGGRRHSRAPSASVLMREQHIDDGPRAQTAPMTLVSGYVVLEELQGRIDASAATRPSPEIPVTEDRHTSVCHSPEPQLADACSSSFPPPPPPLLAVGNNSLGSAPMSEDLAPHSSDAQSVSGGRRTNTWRLRPVTASSNSNRTSRSPSSARGARAGADVEGASDIQEQRVSQSTSAGMVVTPPRVVIAEDEDICSHPSGESATPPDAVPVIPVISRKARPETTAESKTISGVGPRPTVLNTSNGAIRSSLTAAATNSGLLGVTGGSVVCLVHSSPSPETLGGEMASKAKSSSSYTCSFTSSYSSSYSSSSSSSSDSGRQERQLAKKIAQHQLAVKQCWQQAVQAPVAMCTILANYAPHGADVWKEKQVVKPFEGEVYMGESSSSSRRLSSDSESHARHHRSSSSSSSSSSSKKKNRRSSSSSRSYTPKRSKRTERRVLHTTSTDSSDRRHHAGVRQFSSHQQSAACIPTAAVNGAPYPVGGLAGNEDDYQEFVVNRQYLEGNYADLREHCEPSVATSGAGYGFGTGIGRDSSSPPSSSRHQNHRHRRNRRHHGSSGSGSTASRSSSTSSNRRSSSNTNSSRSNRRSGKGKKKHHHRKHLHGDTTIRGAPSGSRREQSLVDQKQATNRSFASYFWPSSSSWIFRGFGKRKKTPAELRHPQLRSRKGYRRNPADELTTGELAPSTPAESSMILREPGFRGTVLHDGVQTPLTSGGPGLNNNSGSSTPRHRHRHHHHHHHKGSSGSSSRSSFQHNSSTTSTSHTCHSSESSTRRTRRRHRRALAQRHGGAAAGANWETAGSAGERIVSYAKVFNATRQRNPHSTFYDAYFLDSGQITCGERRRKNLILPGYRTTIIGFVEKKVLKKDLNAHFYVQHPSLEVREIKLTQLRKIRHELLQYVMEESSPLELSTMAHAYWYFERLAEQGMVGKTNRKVILAACVVLAIKFLETGDVLKKIDYFRQRWLRFHKTGAGGVSAGNVMAVGGGTGGGGGGSAMGGSPTAEEKEEEKEATVDWEEVWRREFTVYVGLDFTLLPERGSLVVRSHVERLLQQINVTPQEYYSKKFVSPEHFSNEYYSIYY
eukprot:gene4695-3388_t